jgi:UDP-glucose:(glucosyl)LPS alpha-1,3-glucosyltransferase
MMHIALAADEAYFPGLAVAVQSILSATQIRGGITFHILDGGIEESTWRKLEGMVLLFGKEVCLQRHRLSLARLADMPPHRSGGLMTYAKLLMPSFVEADEVIYVDADMLLFRDLRELWAEPLGDDLAAVCQDVYVKTFQNDWIPILSEQERDDPYFNAGFFKVNLQLWRQEDVQGRALRMLREYGEKLKWHDNTALNYCLKGRARFLDPRWNRSSFEVYSVRDFSEDKMNIHYVTARKPWLNYDCSNATFIVWRLCRAKWMPDIGRPKGVLEPLKGACHDWWSRETGMALTDGLFRFLESVSWHLRLWKASRRLEWWRGQFEYVRYVGKQLHPSPHEGDLDRCEQPMRTKARSCASAQ